MTYQNKGDNNWQITSNNYACWHNTFFSFCFIVPIMHRFWKYRTGIGVCSLSARPGQLNWTEHACLSCLDLCAFLCASTSFTSACISVPHARPIPQHLSASSTKVSLSTAINKDFFRGISSYVTVVCTCY